MANYSKDHPWRREFAVMERKRKLKELYSQKAEEYAYSPFQDNDLASLSYNGYRIQDIVAEAQLN